MWVELEIEGQRQEATSLSVIWMNESFSDAYHVLTQPNLRYINATADATL